MNGAGWSTGHQHRPGHECANNRDAKTPRTSAAMNSCCHHRIPPRTAPHPAPPVPSCPPSTQTVRRRRPTQEVSAAAGGRLRRALPHQPSRSRPSTTTCNGDHPLRPATQRSARISRSLGPSRSGDHRSDCPLRHHTPIPAEARLQPGVDPAAGLELFDQLGVIGGGRERGLDVVDSLNPFATPSPAARLRRPCATAESMRAHT